MEPEHMDIDSNSSENSDDGISSNSSQEDNLYHKTPTRLQSPPLGRGKEVIAKTPFASEYRSIFTIQATGPPGQVPTVGDANLMKCLANVNCSYLSSRGRAPTLLELKKHAHSLTVLIKQMTLSTTNGIVDNQSFGGSIARDASFLHNESFDWLNNLNKPYHTDDRHHGMPLTTLMNTIETDVNPESEYGFRNICPLYTCPPHKPGETLPDKYLSQPYATHTALIQHANEALEYLDHEYSARGGLLSIVPTIKENPEARKQAEGTVLGQLILYSQRLVRRLHDMERHLSDALDVLKGEANAPHQILSRLGPDGRKPRDVVYPQDRFVLVNAGEDVWNYLQQEMTQKELSDVSMDEYHRSLGVMGERLWEKDGGTEFAKGLTAIDITTRYYRLRNDPLKTIFVIPAHEKHPGTAATRKMMNEPTVVSVVKPLWPERISMWEQKHRKELDALRKHKWETDNWMYKEELLENQVKVLKFDRDSWREKFYHLEADKNYPTRHEADQRRAPLSAALSAEKEKYEELVAKQDEVNRKYKERLAAVQKTQVDMQKLKRETDEDIKRREAALEFREARLHAIDSDLGHAAEELPKKLRKLWESQLAETLAVKIFLEPMIPPGKTIPQTIKDRALLQAQKEINDIIPHTVSL